MFLFLQRHNVVLVSVLLILLFSLFYLKHATYQIERPLAKETSHSSLPPPPLPVSISKLPVTADPDQSPCDKVDSVWLASDRTYWDGWVSKAMFMRRDGKFTTKNLTISAGESLCVIVMLGPIPAVAAIKPKIHFAPTDSITISATGNLAKIPINMQQHPKQSNVYFSPVHFAQPDTYRLESTTEYRSYFWESPIYHPHRPFHYTSHNTLTVTSSEERPPISFCDSRSSPVVAFTGAWINQEEFQRVYPLDFYEILENPQGNYAVDQRCFVPDACRLRSLTSGQVSQYLGPKTIHVWGDDQIKRNMKAFVSDDQWCRTSKDTDGCGCNDDWDLSVTTSNNNVTIMYNALDSLYNLNWGEDLRRQAAELPKADVVILGVGNHEVGINRLSPRLFWDTLMDFLHEVTTHIYPTQTIVLRTPQYFCCGTMHNSAWNQGRSRAFANIFRQAAQQLDTDRIILWDIHKIGVDDNACPGSINSKRNLINVENNLLWNVLCPSSLLS